ncbi:MAG: DAK2 domain-containing protein [Ruminococcus sp.]|uniref:DAK2 domain-containing protein n=1 Tax=Ruminococcus sp. TaxID=41978 RepID=UPI002873422D|nr:DAK2 domain-containing protein [Ruminococcus sp.]MBQ3284505.1 DAK2 domain-containing protein [Ruminococcus sp.]
MMNGETLKQAIISGANNISSIKARINDLNIFPVPDGDTGTNMSMTIVAAAEALKNAEAGDVAEVSKLTASAMLRGARGNSGVITSLLFRGISKGLEGKAEATGADLIHALGLGVEAAYNAVTKPTEGTILTVARMGYEAGLEALETEDDPAVLWEIVCDASLDALEQTPEMLPVLKKAGVVDAGGKGILTIFEGMLSVIRDGVVVEYSEEAYEKENDDDFFRSAAAEFDQVINFTYCTEFIVGRDPEVEEDPNDLRLYLETIGDSIVLVADDEIIKVHVHTEQPGNALQHGLTYGSLLTVKIENMKEQHKKAKEDNEKAKAKTEKKAEPVIAEPTEEFGFVAVAAGEGLCNLFNELGCLNVVSGGQSMNPSTDDILEAVLATPAKKVFVLPNNKNIIMAAEQTVALVEDREVIIVPTRTIPQGLSAMLVFDPDCDADTNVYNMKQAAKNVATGQVTFAARDSEFGARRIKEGEIIGLDNGKLTVTSSSPNRALYKLAKSMINRDMSFVTLISGEGVSEEEAAEAVEMLENKFADQVDITYIKGDQPIYYYIFSVE